MMSKQGSDHGDNANDSSNLPPSNGSQGLTHAPSGPANNREDIDETVLDNDSNASSGAEEASPAKSSGRKSKKPKKTKTTKKARGMQWTTKALVAVLEYVQECSGSSSPFLAKSQTPALLEALRRAMPHLDQATQDLIDATDDKQRKAKVRDRLGHIWKDCGRAGSIENLYRDGLRSLHRQAFNKHTALRDVDFHEITSIPGGQHDIPDSDILGPKKPPNTLEPITPIQSPLMEGATSSDVRPNGDGGDDDLKSHKNPQGSSDAPHGNKRKLVASLGGGRSAKRSKTSTTVEDKVDGIVEAARIFVEKLLDGLSIPQDQNLVQDLSAQTIVAWKPSQELCEVLGCMMAVDAVKADICAQLQTLLLPPFHERMKVGVFIRGMIGAAIQKWCLEPFSQDALWKASFVYDTQKEAEAVGGSQQARLGTNHAALESDFGIAARARAVMLARIFVKQHLVFALPAGHTLDHAENLEQTNMMALVLGPAPRKDELAILRELRTSLQCVFEQASILRLHLELDNDSESPALYTFKSKIVMPDYVRRSSDTDDEVDNDYGASAETVKEAKGDEKVVMFSVFPGISKTTNNQTKVQVVEAQLVRTG
jgi:hypothetical protein